MGPFQNPSETYHYFDLPFCKPAEAISLGTSTLWVTHGKTFETWICPLAHLLCGYCTDVILRLCQEIVFLKVEVVELLLPSVLAFY
ncbi:serine/threonine-protein kinase ATM-like isoform X3 [Humulus lupulus]|uniref:serine/threonine-protein kinase ATM-like isoform X3 n=1 Tax=Humulus lupulus TaxID=3486 RepID=UPI002B411F59|nr:serine/threonine-protein kinase ATM-like isoform X3 [Humulus lupulus]